MRRLPSLAVLLALATGCPSATLLRDEDRVQVTRELEGKEVYLRPSVYVLPFFSDTSRWLLSPLPPECIHLLEDTSGKPILPGAPERIVPAGTAVRIDKVEFPTSLAVTRRPLYSPRTNPWIYVSIAGKQQQRPHVAVLRPGLRTREEFLSAMDQLFVDKDPAVFLSGFSAETRTAIFEKHVLAGMDPDAVQMSWGRPERIRVEYVEGVRTEAWTWPLGKRAATFRDGKLTDTTPPLSAKSE
jgi:hypothetical protein